MIRHFTRRMVNAVLLLFIVSVLTFLFIEVAPGEFFSEMRLNPQISSQTVEGLRRQHGMEDSLLLRYTRWLKSLVRGELGYSLAYNMPVATLLRVRARNTVLLTSLGTTLAWTIALPVGIWAALKNGRWFRRIFGASTTFLLSTPQLMVALCLLMVAVRTQRFPAGGMTSAGFADLNWSARAADLAVHFVLPVVAIIVGTVPVLVRHVRSSMLEALNSTPVQAARYHGLSQRTVLLRYALRSAANPLICLLGFSIASLLSASLLVEVVMGWPGLGPLLLEAALAHDIYVVIAAALSSTMLVVGGNLLADMALYLSDPRIRVNQS